MDCIVSLSLLQTFFSNDFLIADASLVLATKGGLR
jgi:hypothetical protein